MARRNVDQYNWERLEFDETLLTKHFTPKNQRDIKGFVVHHMIILNKQIDAPDALDVCFNVWQDRPASAHYGVDGRFVRQYVWDKDYAWANGHTWANDHFLSVEHANMTLNEAGTHNDYLVDEETWRNGAKLIGYGHKTHALGAPRMGATVRKHGEFSATECPGPHLGGTIWHDYNEEVGRVYDAAMSGRVLEDHVPAPVVADNNGIYVVQSGDTLSKIGLKHDTSWKKLQDLNGLPNPNLIRVGQKIKVSGTPVKPIAQVVQEVINGAWGNNPQRVAKLRDAGYDPVAVQNEVNRRLG